MTSKIILYKNSHIEYGKNFIVDDISTYLSTLTKTELTSVQAQKIQKAWNSDGPSEVSGRFTKQVQAENGKQGR